MRINRPALVATLIALLSFQGACVIVMNRRFEGRHRFHPLNSDWQVGVPVLEALGHTSNRSIWDSQVFTPYIPFTSLVVRDAFKELRSDVASGRLMIDSVYFRPLKSGVQYSRAIRVRNETAPDSGQVIVGLSQHYIQKTVPIVLFDTISIHADEDSVLVEFTVVVREENKMPVDSHYSFILTRREGKKLALDNR